MNDVAFTRDSWARAQTNLTLAAFDTDLRSILLDDELSGFQKQVLFWLACEAAGEALEKYGAFTR